MDSLTSQQQQQQHKENTINDEINKPELNFIETPTTTTTTTTVSSIPSTTQTPTAIDDIGDGNDNVAIEESTATTNNTGTAITNNCNQETDLAAMSTKAIHDIPPPVNLIATKTTTTAIAANTCMSPAIPSYIYNEITTTTTTATTSNHQFVTPQKPLHASSLSSSSATSTAVVATATPITMKKSHKFSKCFVGNNNNIVSGDQDSSSSSLANAIANAATSSLSSSSIAAAANMKTSLSMTSLPPDEKLESRDGIKAKLKVERPYNSLKVSQLICFCFGFLFFRSAIKIRYRTHVLL